MKMALYGANVCCYACGCYAFELCLELIISFGLELNANKTQVVGHGGLSSVLSVESLIAANENCLLHGD